VDGLEDHVVAVDDFVAVGVAEGLRDAIAAEAADAAEFVAAVVCCANGNALAR
jgi:hypothetical protein